jgi:hypothetical protein
MDILILNGVEGLARISVRECISIADYYASGIAEQTRFYQIARDLMLSGF